MSTPLYDALKDYAARRTALLLQFDTAAAELLFLGATIGELTARLETTAREKRGV